MYYFFGVVVIVLVIIISIIISKNTYNKYKCPPENFHLIRQNFNFPDKIYLSNSENSQEHSLFLVIGKELILIECFLPGNTDLAFKTSKSLLKKIYGDKIENISLESRKYTWTDKLYISFEKNHSKSSF